MPANTCRHPSRWLTLALGGMMCVTGCGYPRVGSDAVELTKVIDTVCNLRAEAQIEPARRILSERLAAGSITEKEHRMLENILSMAEQGDWESAAGHCRRLLEAQTTPAPH